jgi:GNAT superfamily N-acetyltransferase
MDDLYVKEKYRKNGIGKRLLDVVIEFARKEKCGKVRWQVSNWNKDAQDFYKKMGAKIDDVELNCDLILQYPR